MEEEVLSGEDQQFLVEKIIGTKIEKNVRFYKVRWTDTWVSEENLGECKEAIELFWKHSGKEKEKGSLEDSRKGYSLRNKDEAPISRKREKRKGTQSSSKKLQKRRRKVHEEEQSSSDEK